MDRPTAGAFERLGDPTRAAILAVLAGARIEEYDLADALGDYYDPASEQGATLSFSELQDRTGVDEPGSLDRQLDALRGSLVERTDAGYRLTHAGTRLAGVLAAAEGEAAPRRARLDAPCRRCGGAVEAAYGGGRLAGECEHCGPLFEGAVPESAAADRPVPELVALQTRLATAEMRLIVDGVCERCHTPVHPRVRRVQLGGVEEHATDGDEGSVAGEATDRADGDGGGGADGTAGRADADPAVDGDGATGGDGDGGTTGGGDDDWATEGDGATGGDGDDGATGDDDGATGGDGDDGSATMAVYAADCGTCGNHNVLSTAAVALVDPRVEAFYRDHGDPLPETPHWTLDLFDPERWRTESVAPLRERFETTRDDERLRVTLSEGEDGRLDTAVERKDVE